MTTLKTSRVWCYLGEHWLRPVLRNFVNQQVVPDLVETLPLSILNVTSDDDIEVNLGNTLTPFQVRNEPNISWDADSDKFYVLIMTDLDVHTRKEPKDREAQHYIVGNIPGSEISEGDVLTEYIGSAPRPGTGLHRYVFMVYEQPEVLTFDEKRLKKDVDLNRVTSYSFTSRKFVEKYGLSEPTAGNFFQAEYVDYVPKWYAELTKNTKH